ncbi:MAG: hypothetical protein PF488_04775 [Patescibacteria group bacterium]|jgi:hypothetical protein|nr:hypothetical protein [Patescibacteria group bacterium]
MNIYKAKINGVFEIDHPLDIKKDYSLALKRCAVKSIVKKDTGEEDNIYTHNLESLDVVTIIDEGKTIKGEPKSMSKKLRGAIFYKGEELGIEDSERFYENTINKIIINLDDILDK